MLTRLVERFRKRRIARELEFLDRQAQTIADLPLAEVKALGKSLRHRRRAMNRVIAQADQRLMLPQGGDPVSRHPSTDWLWRPQIMLAPLVQKSFPARSTGAEITNEIKIFHDCRTSEVSLRQSRNQAAQDYTPFGLTIETFDFDGSFLSLAIDLPEAVLNGIESDHILQLDLRLESEAQLELIARLNLKHGPNITPLLRDIPLSPEGAPARAMVEFDLAYAKLEDRRIEKLWIDLIFGSVEMNQISLCDISVSRRLRSQL